MRIAAAVAAQMSTALVRWYRRAKRDLPWRNTRDPYAILVSEIMLQQTQVATALGYYARFLERFPDMRSLADASADEVMAAWAGLGYYRRAVLLHRLAGIVVKDHAGRFPESVAEIERLPGVGRYSAGAVASFAFGGRAPIVEANSARVLTRLFAIRGDLKSTEVRKLLWRCAEELLPVRNTRDHNYAFMELGALVCVPAGPRCDECPLRRYCRAFADGTIDSIPARTDPRPRVAREFVGIAVEHNGAFLLGRIPLGQWHAGLYEFPKYAIAPGSPASTQLRILRRATGPLLGNSRPTPFGEFRFTVTRHVVRLVMWRAMVSRIAKRRGGRPAVPSGCAWYGPDEIRRLPLPAVQKRIVKVLLSDCDAGTMGDSTGSRGNDDDVSR